MPLPATFYSSSTHNQCCSMTQSQTSDYSSIGDVDNDKYYDDDDDDDDDDYDKKRNTKQSSSYTKPSEFSVVDDDDDDDETNNNSQQNFKMITNNISDRKKISSVTNKSFVARKDHTTHGNNKKIKRTIKRRKEPSSRTMIGTSWMDKNAKFNGEDVNSNTSHEVENTGQQSSSSLNNRNDNNNISKRNISDPKTFRENFRETRVFVENIPQGVTWGDLKDHFKAAGNVVFASVSVDVNTGESKGHGIVQYETTEMAQNAVRTMRDYPLNGKSLFVREDRQESKDPNSRLRKSPSSFSDRQSNSNRRPTPPTKWKCANEDNVEHLSEGEKVAISNLISQRDSARKRKDYDVSDRLRDELKTGHGVFIDDRLKMWWTSDGNSNKVPKNISDIKGDGRWGKVKPWRQIPTTPENDSLVDPGVVEELLQERDMARRKKDFETADRFLQEARNSPNGDLTLRIHDESRTWRIWTETRPPPVVRRTMPTDPGEAKQTAVKECVDIIRVHAPEKLEEIVHVLKKYRGREFQILKRLKQQYL